MVGIVPPPTASTSVGASRRIVSVFSCSFFFELTYPPFGINRYARVGVLVLRAGQSNPPRHFTSLRCGKSTELSERRPGDVPQSVERVS
jgi:hypothetical protein